MSNLVIVDIDALKKLSVKFDGFVNDWVNFVDISMCTVAVCDHTSEAKVMTIPKMGELTE